MNLVQCAYMSTDVAEGRGRIEQYAEIAIQTRKWRKRRYILTPTKSGTLPSGPHAGEFCWKYPERHQNGGQISANIPKCRATYRDIGFPQNAQMSKRMARYLCTGVSLHVLLHVGDLRPAKTIGKRIFKIPSALKLRGEPQPALSS